MTTFISGTQYAVLGEPVAREAVSAAVTSDRALVTAVLSGDKKAFGELIKAHDPAVRSMVAGLLADRSAVDDVLQDAYLKAYRSLGSFKQSSSFKTWLYRIAYNASIDELRRSKRREHTEMNEQVLPLVSAESSIYERLDVIQALARLPQAQRTCALLIDGHGFDYRSVASLLDVPVGTVASHTHEARKFLRARLGMSEKDSDR